MRITSVHFTVFHGIMYYRRHYRLILPFPTDFYVFFPRRLAARPAFHVLCRTRLYRLLHSLFPIIFRATSRVNFVFLKHYNSN